MLANWLGKYSMSRGTSGILRAGTALGFIVVATAQAGAGAFAIREQSTIGQGASFAGVAAGGAPSSTFWNPATMTQMPGIQSESTATGVFPYATHSPQAGSTFGTLGGASNSGQAGLVPGSYFSYQFNPNLWLGVSVSAPFGLSVSFPDRWAGRNYAGDTTLETYNATPMLAYRINDWISVGVGVQIQYAKADLNNGLPTGLGQSFDIKGRGWGYGATAGVTLTPTPTTTIGLGWRSAINQKIQGTLLLPGGAGFNPPFSTPGSVETTLDLPDVVSLGIRQRLDQNWTLLGTVEWSNWSRIGTSTINQLNGAPATILAGLGGGPVTLPFKYDDGWFFSAGSEYRWNERLTLRSGIGYEISPITDQVRTPRLPDNDRFWASVGASWEVWRGFSFDVAYSHLWVKDPNINISAASGNPWFNGVTYIGDVSAHVDILSVGMRYRWDEAAPGKKPLITK
jgi:long-chain fatty acid transport protein